MIAEIDNSTVTIVQTAAMRFFARLFSFAESAEPFDLTAVTEIVAIFPGLNGVPVKKTLSNSGGITIIGAAGAGKIRVALTTIDTQSMQPNPQINQNLQIIVTLAGVAQVDTIAFGAPPVSGTKYTIALKGSPFSYTAKSADTAQDVFNALKPLIDVSGLPIGAVISGTGNTAHLVLTSTIAALGFTDAVSDGMGITPSVPNGGTRTPFLLQQVLNILPLDFNGS